MKPILENFEFHTCDHCNFNCKGCGHFSNIAKQWFYDVEMYYKDIKKMNKLLDVRQIRILGGEPLLHDRIEDFLIYTRKVFKKAKIQVVSNGVLIPKMKESFWEQCRVNDIIINLSIYPPLFNKYNKIVELVKEKGVKVISHKTDRFFARTNIKGDSDPHKAMKVCRDAFFCPFLRNGKLYVCGKPALIDIYNKEYNERIPSGKGIDLYDESLTGEKIMNLLFTPIETCKYCTLDFKSTFEWEVSKNKDAKKEDWLG